MRKLKLFTPFVIFFILLGSLRFGLGALKEKIQKESFSKASSAVFATFSGQNPGGRRLESKWYKHNLRSFYAKQDAQIFAGFKNNFIFIEKSFFVPQKKTFSFESFFESGSARAPPQACFLA